ncbi:MAG: hypothetical protein NTV68_01175, partial [Methanomicrobiales archaeon]|nr:hypothetical protein [Methanomicrobiales archaeon]
MKGPLNNENYPVKSGFLNDIGAHTGRTIMFKELALLFNATTKINTIDEIRNMVYDENILHKKSISGRKKSFSNLKKTYGLDPTIPLYNTLRWAWDVSEEKERPLLALLCALSRDASLRVTAPYIFSLIPGKIADKEKVSALIEQNYPNRYSPASITSMTQNLLSSWTQSGHLKGIKNKTRIKVDSNTPACVFALATGYLAGFRGRLLLDTIWMRSLDATDYEIKESISRAMKKGWVRYRESGGMME